VMDRLVRSQDKLFVQSTEQARLSGVA
jgi:hypothetical protein